MQLRTVLGIAMMLAACGGGNDPSPSAACDDIQAALCERIYACFTPDELAAAGYPSAEAACVTMAQADAGCAVETAASACVGNQTYHADQAATCSDQIAGLDCSQVRSANNDVQGSAPACALVCAVD